MRFDQLIRPGMTVREVRQRYPQTAPIFERLGFRSSCDDCSIEVVARKYGLSPADIVEALNEAVVGPREKEPRGPVQ
ncbi:MAG: hypothetical protein RMK57_07140 [Bryobacterales bacterium]|nr:hypothetical protein [Bryobacteraceae bacterium]MDW8354289.1 hypothetical protein [Bryobacterales bacterium]